MTITNTSYEAYSENESERKIREYSTLPDPRRPSTEHYMEYFYNYIALEKTPDMDVLPLTIGDLEYTYMLPHSDLFYIRAALEDKFPDRLFTIEEVRGLVDQEFGIRYSTGKNVIFK